MNAIIFSTKRAFHRSLAVTRQPLASLGLTAARFDMLYALLRNPMHAEMQSRLRRILGVSAPTVSRMLRSLEELGLVTRRRAQIDTRQRWVELTPRGLERIRRAHWLLTRYGAVQLAVDCALTHNRAHDGHACFTAMGVAEGCLDALRSGFGDTATLFYPWHPDD